MGGNTGFPSASVAIETWVNEALHNTGSAITDDQFDAEGHELASQLSDELKWTVVYEGRDPTIASE
jgi:hypothetical protein